MIFFQTCHDIFKTKLKKSYAFIQDQIEKKYFQKTSFKCNKYFYPSAKENFFDRINYRTVIAFRI